jgi:hypothetical protein
LTNRIAGSVACLNVDWSVERSYSQPHASLELREGYLHPLRRELQPLFTTWSGIHEPLRAPQLKDHFAFRMLAVQGTIGDVECI